MYPLPQLKKRIWPYLNMSNFYGGLNKRNAPSEIADNEAQDLLNIDLTDGGGFAKRAGTNIVGDDVGNTATLGVHSMYYGLSSAKMLMANQAATTSGLFYRTTTTWTEAVLNGAAAKLANATTCFETFLITATGREVAFIADGTNFQYFNPLDNKIYVPAGVPATIGSMLKVYKNRLYSRGNGTLQSERIYFSSLGTGESWPAANYLNVPSQSTAQVGGTGDFITALAVLQDRLIIFKNRSIWSWDTVRLRKISDFHGAVAQNAVYATDNYCYFADNDGVYRLSGTTVLKISKKIQPIWDLIPAAIIRKVTIGYFKGKLYVATGTTGATYNNIILVNYTTLPQDSEGQQPWSYWKGTTANPLAAQCFTVYEASTTTLPILAYGCANAQSACVQLETGNADYEFAGSAQNESIDGYYKTKDFTLPARFKKLFLAMKKRASSYNLNVSAVIDFQTTRHLTYDMYAAAGDALTKGSKISYNGKYINYKFATSASSAQPFMVYDAKQEYKPLRLK